MYRTGVINIYYLTLSLLWALRESVYGQHNVWWHSAWHILRALMLAGIIYYPEVEVSALFGPWLLHLASLSSFPWPLPGICPSSVPSLQLCLSRWVEGLLLRSPVWPHLHSHLYIQICLYFFSSNCTIKFLGRAMMPDLTCVSLSICTPSRAL